MSNIGDRIRERDKLVCELYISGVAIKDIAERSNISIGTLYNIIKKHGIELRQDANKSKIDKAVETVCEYFDLGVSIEGIADVVKAEVGTIILILRKHRPKQLENYFKRIKIQEEISRRRAPVPKYKGKNPIKGKLAEMEKEELKVDRPELDGMYNEYLERAMLGYTGETKDEKRDAELARAYVKGIDIKQILEEYGVSNEYMCELLEYDSDVPGYFPDRPPLKM